MTLLSSSPLVCLYTWPSYLIRLPDRIKALTVLGL